MKAPSSWSGAGAALAVTGWFFAGLLWAGRFGGDPAGIVLASIAHGLTVLAVLAVLARFQGGTGLVEPLFGVRVPPGRVLARGGAGGVLAAAGALGLVWFLERLRGNPIADDRHPVVLLLCSPEAGLFRKGLTLALAVGLAPLAEEILFRRVLQSAFSHALRPAAAVLATALLFGLAHHTHADFPWTFPVHAWIGTVLGTLFLKTGSLWPGVLAHAANNAVALAWALWGS